MKTCTNRLKRILLLFGCLLLIIAMKPVTSVKADDTVYDETVDGVHIVLKTDKTEYKAGEPVYYTLVVENTKEHSYLAESNIAYDNTEGVVENVPGSMPVKCEKVNSGEPVTVTGAARGSVAVFGAPAAENENPVPAEVTDNNTSEEEKNVFPIVVIIVVVAAAVVAVVILILLKKKKSARALAAGLAILMGIGSAGSVSTEAVDYETIKARPYVKVTYEGSEFMIRMIMEFHRYPEKVQISREDRNTPKTISCHDPSIFKDFDGTYYILGTHITGGYTKDLRNWTDISGSFRASFTQDTIKKIREWNKDSGDWYGYLWAPDVVYNPVLRKYCYYLSANGDDWKSNIVMLTSDNIQGPYEYAGSVVYGGFNASTIGETDALQVLGTDTIPDRYVKNGVDNRKWGDKWPNCIDPCVFYDDDGNLWMSYGSWSGGIFMLALDENTGLRDYSVTYETDNHSDAYFGKKIAGGWYVSGEGSYIQKIGDYYWLFVSYGGLEAKSGYNIRVFRSERPDGDYVDMLGNSPLYDKYTQNFNQSVGVRLFSSYKWRTFSNGQVAQGHNSAFVDDDGRAYIIYHTRTTDGSEGHTVKVHQLFLNSEGWLVAAPYITDGETLPENGVDMASFAGEYEIIKHRLNINYAKLDVCTPEYIHLNEDGTITGAYTGTWEVKPSGSYIYLYFDNGEYSGVAFNMKVENTKLDTDVFTAVDSKTQITLWGSKILN